MTDNSAQSDDLVSTSLLAKIGAVAYVLWGLWHIRVVIRMFQAAAAMEDPALQARIFQGAFHILFFAVFAIVVAWWIARNNRISYWAQLLTIGWTEVGLFLFFMLPGLFPWWPSGWIGPTLWIVAVATTTVARVRA
ncbi:hypothetical protein [Roseobacter sinensis]|uniref:Uncharacterized protein n=1 Tax=Roseobacter sinensis TaxID=2931391 RepID=A0ABT3B919_9RHOB|nr:hypothetical protein [Roseobacter sp. WL0113]MCV3270066.1 hypothetical protein [Roseobacter sp. WL0113]